MSVSLRASIVLAIAVLLKLPIAAQFSETDLDRDLRSFYQGTDNRAVWIDAQGRPTPDAHHAVARLDRCRLAREHGYIPP